jgi:hypothetical protein
MKETNIENQESIYPNFGTALTQTDNDQDEVLLCKQIKLKTKFKIGDKAVKPKGYQFPCTIVSVFTTKKGNVRVVAEMDGYGLLHIFNENQLEHRVIPPAEYHK